MAEDLCARVYPRLSRRSPAVQRDGESVQLDQVGARQKSVSPVGPDGETLLITV